MYHVHGLPFGASHEDIAVLGQFYAEVITAIQLIRKHVLNF